MEPRLSVIIPLAPDEIEAQDLLNQLCALPDNSEIITVKARDIPVHRPAGWPATLTLREYINAGGRARQMNLGARVARGEWLWFVHADSRLPISTLPALIEFIKPPNEALGWFDLRFRGDGPWLVRLNALGANLRSRLWGLPFGDQGLLLKRTCFETLGGFDEQVECGEDHYLVWTARDKGLAIKRIGAPLATSARKYAQQGWLKTTARHLWLTLMQVRDARRHRSP